LRVRQREKAATVADHGSRPPRSAVFDQWRDDSYLDLKRRLFSLPHGRGPPQRPPSRPCWRRPPPNSRRAAAGDPSQRPCVWPMKCSAKIADVLRLARQRHAIHHDITGHGGRVSAPACWLDSPEQMVAGDRHSPSAGNNSDAPGPARCACRTGKAFAAADACRKAMFSVELAHDGFMNWSRPKKVFEGTYGFFRW